jgi:hypothetical protein
MYRGLWHVKQMDRLYVLVSSVVVSVFVFAVTVEHKEYDYLTVRLNPVKSQLGQKAETIGLF